MGPFSPDLMDKLAADILPESESAGRDSKLTSTSWAEELVLDGAANVVSKTAQDLP